MRILKKILKPANTTIFAVCLLISQVGIAQKKMQFSVGTELNQGKLSTGNTTINDAFVNAGIGINLGASYTLNTNFSLHTGVGYNLYKSQLNIDSNTSSESTVDNVGEAFEFNYTLNNFSEKQEFTAISVPIAFQYETSGDVRFYSKIGFEANLFQRQEFSATAESLSTTGFFPRFNTTLDAPKFTGFGSFDNPSLEEKKLEINNSYHATLEVGIKNKFQDGSSLYLGLFAKYGLNNVATSNNTANVISFQAEDPNNFSTTSMLNAVEPNQNSNNSFSEARLHIFGTIFTYEFSF